MWTCWLSKNCPGEYLAPAELSVSVWSSWLHTRSLRASPQLPGDINGGIHWHVDMLTELDLPWGIPGPSMNSQFQYGQAGCTHRALGDLRGSQWAVVVVLRDMDIRVQRIRLFKKINNTDPLMGAKFKYKTHFLFGVVFCAFGFKVWKSTNMTSKKTFWKNQKRYQKTQNFMLISNPLKKILKM
jgi:hypothetical protein